MNRYIKNGKILERKDIQIITTETYEEGGEVFTNTSTTFNPSDEMCLADGWEKYDGCLEEDIQNKIDEINKYDTSDEINIFYIDEIPMWFNKTDRVILKDRFEREIALSKEETLIKYKTYVIKLTPAKALEIITNISQYADLCFDKTCEHIIKVSVLQNRKDVKNYNYKVGYPSVLHLNSK